jgi:hypothetical protein
MAQGYGLSSYGLVNYGEPSGTIKWNAIVAYPALNLSLVKSYVKYVLTKLLNEDSGL